MNMIKHYRKKSGLTQQELAKFIGVEGGQRLISYYESGDRRPNIDRCRVIVEGLNSAGVNCTLDDVFPPEPVKQQKAG